MKKQGFLLLLVLLCLASTRLAAQTAQARMYCLSLRVAQGTDDMGMYTLEFSTIPGGANGELAPTFGQPTHYTNFRLYDTTWDMTTEGTMDINVPLSKDDNQDGFPDFFEVSQSISGGTTGTFEIFGGVDAGTVRATWSRAAGSKDGTCVIQMTGSVYGQLPAFTHTFELLEYAGPLKYTPGTNRVTGTVDLQQTGAPANRFVGPIAFDKSSTDRFNVLHLADGAWTNELNQTLPFPALPDDLQRDLALSTNYYGYFDFEDGDLATTEIDYATWILSVDDVNDADKDGIPDFSDDPTPVVVQPPNLGLVLTSSNLVMTVTGTMGRVHEIQLATSLALKDWTTLQSVTLTNSPQTLPLSLPAAGVGFWRVRVP